MTEANINPECLREEYQVFTTDQLISVLTHGLTAACSSTRAPNNFDASLQAACLEPDNSLSRILLKAGFQVWFAYFLASQQGRTGGFDQLANEDLALVVDKIAHITPHQSVTQLFSHLFGGWRGQTRSNSLKNINVKAPSLTEPPSFNTRPLKRARTSIQNIANIAMHDDDHPTADAETVRERQRSTANIYDSVTSGQGTSATTFVAIYGLVGFEVNSCTQILFPSASYLGHVFPMYLTSIIAKENGNAWLRVSFGDDYTKCELEFFISASEIQHVAKELFNLHIATKDHLRGILLDNDVFMKVNGSLIMSGTQPEKVGKLLGMQAMEAYQLSPSRIEEVNNGQTKVTSCLTMEIWPQVDCPSRLSLSMEVDKLTSITGYLWPPMKKPSF